ncbi:MAG: hypothetical protein WDN23_05390 [Edaphobacter sp.]
MARFILRLSGANKISSALDAIRSSSAKVVDQTARMLLVEAPEDEMMALKTSHPEFTIAPEVASYSIPPAPRPMLAGSGLVKP